MSNDSQPLFKGLIRALMSSGVPAEGDAPLCKHDPNGYSLENRNFNQRSGLSQ
ncbi:hypothetical protein [Pseudomonas chlororaphis]|uniref:hypothetical protein n=1 Tax=Pseudomonas chlororaphis TaxID=587753 RepID=UPI000A67156C|nr:hypothetical protein [Pseudomonas chlororaphis]AZC99917.1 hypothetical protein C4K27_0697 [Pseudomonas chlororaphis subsp. chlororaphis]MBM0285838.1 hypothetical protein [Pseudomonas chlororaphis]MDO1505950.1 hypothetical protein [Pseudomonas chlororaphis]WDG98361.1 hypothetical protein PUP54_01970 [Pseudomonas chlororaphis]WDH17368.1 hypothetical protein PUP70_04475 [Pseudomonas chlororaphis]